MSLSEESFCVFLCKILTLMPALRHLETASGTVERGGSIMDRSPTKHRLEVGKFMESVSNWKVSGNSFSGRYKWQKPEEMFRLGVMGRKMWESLIKHQCLLFPMQLQQLTFFNAGCAKTLNPISQVLQLDFTSFSFFPHFPRQLHSPSTLSPMPPSSM